MEESKGLDKYRKLLADRPEKFTGKEADYTPAARNKSDYFCKDCKHFFTGKVAGYNVCEVVRLHPEMSIEPKARCRYWTRTGERFPILNNHG